MPKQCMKCEIPPLELVAVDRRPFGKHDVARMVAHGLERQGIAPNDIPFQYKPDGVVATVLGLIRE